MEVADGLEEVDEQSTSQQSIDSNLGSHEINDILSKATTPRLHQGLHTCQNYR